MFDVQSRTIRRLSLFLVMGAAMLVTACAEPISPDYRDTFALKVEKKTYAIAVKFTGDGNTIDRRSKNRIKGFAREFHRRSRTPLMVSSVAGENDPGVLSRLNTVRDTLVGAGIPAAEIIVKPGLSTIGTEDVVVISFRGYKVKLPECGDWSGESAFTPNNRPHTNFGCAYQRNIGLMISDPGDLIRPDALAPPDPDRLDAIVEGFKAEGVEAKGEEGTVQ